MGRNPRPKSEGATYHIYSRGNNKQRIYYDARDYARFLQELATVQKLLPFVLYAYCLMPNHFHLVMKVLALPMELIMHRLLGRYASAFNRRWDRVGHVFQDRYHHKVVDTDAYLLQAIAYVHYNPVKAGLVEKVEDWPWSSHDEYVGEPWLTDTHWPLSLLGGSRAAALAEYSSRLSLACSIELDFGSELETAPLDSEADSAGRPSPAGLEALARLVAARTGVRAEDLASGLRRDPFRSARLEFVAAALRGGHGLGDVGNFLGRSRSQISRIAAEAARCAIDATDATPGTED